jgi:hypothetical protein
MIEPESSWNVTLLFMWIELHDRYVPDGNRRMPSPVLLAAVTARLIAAVSLEESFGVAPWSRTSMTTAFAPGPGTTTGGSGAGS